MENLKYKKLHANKNRRVHQLMTGWASLGWLKNLNVPKWVPPSYILSLATTIEERYFLKNLIKDMNDSVWCLNVSLDDISNSFSKGKGHLDVVASSLGGTLNNFSTQGLNGACANIGGVDFGSDDMAGQYSCQLGLVGDQATDVDTLKSRISWSKNGEWSVWK